MEGVAFIGHTVAGFALGALVALLVWGALKPPIGVALAINRKERMANVYAFALVCWFVCIDLIVAGFNGAPSGAGVAPAIHITALVFASLLGCGLLCVWVARLVFRWRV